jgi:hypothetical protein
VAGGLAAAGLLVLMLAVAAGRPSLPPQPPSEPVAVPDVVGLPAPEAVAQLSAAGLQPRVVGECSGGPDGVVLRVERVQRSAWWGVSETLVDGQGVRSGAAELQPGARVLVRVATDGEGCGWS